jgi:hypothetical protein
LIAAVFERHDRVVLLLQLHDLLRGGHGDDEVDERPVVFMPPPIVEPA